jgi:uncharacterized protein (DUF433 family)
VNLDNYFNFLGPDDIRIKGTRIGIETVLDDYLSGSSAEEIAARYRSVTLEQVYATLTYYLHNKAEMDTYLARWRAYCDASWREQERNPPEIVLQMRERLERARTMMIAEKGPEYLVAGQS